MTLPHLHRRREPILKNTSRCSSTFIELVCLSFFLDFSIFKVFLLSMYITSFYGNPNYVSILTLKNMSRCQATQAKDMEIRHLRITNMLNKAHHSPQLKYYVITNLHSPRKYSSFVAWRIWKQRMEMFDRGRPSFQGWKSEFIKEACLQAHRLQPDK